ncbi:MAG: EI24 domain-containing protein, partial [Cocleimonas sp.]|nr:EI24 domain-containing protein [Cocleimonas sp.]
MFKNVLAGIGYLFQGLSLISKKGIRPFVVIPLLVNIGVFSFAIWMAKAQFDGIMARLLGWLPSWLSWVEYLLYPLFAVVILIAIYYVFTLIANLIAAPFNSLLAERVEMHLK